MTRSAAGNARRYPLDSHYAAIPARLQTLLDLSHRERSRTQWRTIAPPTSASARARLLHSGERLRIAVSAAAVQVDDRLYPLSLPAGDPPVAIRIGAWIPTGATIRVVEPQASETLDATRDLSVIEHPIHGLPFDIELRNAGKRGVLIAGWLELRGADALDLPSDEDDLFARYRSAVLPGSAIRVVYGWNRRERAERRPLRPVSVRRWTSKRRAVAVFQNPHRLVGLKVEGMLPQYLAGEPLRLDIAVNGQPIGVIEGQQDFAFTQLLDPELLGDASWADLELSVSRTVNPKHLGVSNDSRDLGVYLQRLDLVEAGLDLPSDGRIDLGTPDARNYLEQGWSYDERDGETTFAWAAANEALGAVHAARPS